MDNNFFFTFSISVYIITLSFILNWMLYIILRLYNYDKTYSIVLLVRILGSNNVNSDGTRVVYVYVDEGSSLNFLYMVYHSLGLPSRIPFERGRTLKRSSGFIKTKLCMRIWIEIERLRDLYLHFLCICVSVLVHLSQWWYNPQLVQVEHFFLQVRYLLGLTPVSILLS